MEDASLPVDRGSDVDSTRGSLPVPARQPVDEKLQKLLDKALYGGGRPSAQKIRNFLNGTWLGEPLHVVLTDLPVGAWTVAMVFDALDLAFDRDEFARAVRNINRNRVDRGSRRGGNRHDGLVRR